jgi:hypothetical protein
MTELLNDPSKMLAAAVIGFLVILVLILLVMNISNAAKIKKLKRKYEKFMNGNDNISLEELIEDCISKTNKILEKNRDIENHINKLERDIFYSIQKVGVVRFNAFDNVGSDLSFSVALLDKNDSGVILSGIYSRENSATYAKPIQNGKSKYALSAEEIQALDIAQKSAYHI